MRNEGGVALVEILVAIIILSATLLSLAAASGQAARQIYHSRRELNMWSAVQSQVDSLRAAGFNNLADGSATVEGYPVSWTVTGTDPKTVTLDIDYATRQGATQTSSVTLTFPAADTLPN
ncbi:MAG: hypothetical protein V3U29_09525 [Phycisphaeraceae bacterium]